MRHLLLVAVVLCAVVTPAIAAERYGLIPAVSGETQKAEARAEGADIPVGTPSLIVGLENYGLFGPDASVAGVVTAKSQLGTCKKAKAVFYGGALAGINAETGGSNELVFGGVLQAELNNIGGIVVVIRPKDGKWLINPGINLTILGWRFH